MVGAVQEAGTFYPEPSYESNGAINAILMEDAMSFSDLAGIQNGLSAGYIVTAALRDNKNEPEKYQAERDAIISKIVDETTGAENEGQVVIMFQDPRDKAEAIKIAEIPHTNTSDMQKTLEERKRIAILTSWSIVDENIVGVPSVAGTGFSSKSDALEKADDLWYGLYLHPEIVQEVEEFYKEVVLQLFYDLEGLTEEDLPDDFEHGLTRNKKFNTIPETALLEGYWGSTEIRKIHGWGPASEEVLEEIRERLNAKNKTTETITSTP